MIQLGMLEESILLILLKCGEINGAGVVGQYGELWDKSISLPTVHVVLKRMEKKGLVESRLSEPDNVRGGKRKRMYKATGFGYNTVNGINTVRNSVWQIIPHIKYNNG